MKKKAGFTLLELLILMVLIGGVVLGFGFIGGVCMGNFWVSEGSALDAVQFINPSAAEVVKLERHVWGYSKAVVKDDEGNEKSYYLDACILQNTDAIPVESL